MQEAKSRRPPPTTKDPKTRHIKNLNTGKDECRPAPAFCGKGGSQRSLNRFFGCGTGN
jgi:hypothetical protein